MAAQIPASLKDWSTTASSNMPAGTSLVGPDLDDNLRALQVAVRQEATRSTIASAATTDIGANDAGSLSVTGTTTITGLGTVSAGIRKVLTFAGALTLTHNAASLILPTAASITTAAGDTACMESLGSGNWKCLWYMRASGASVAVQSFALSDLANATANKTLANVAFQQTWGWAWASGTANVGMRLNGVPNTTIQNGTTLEVYASITGTGGRALRAYGESTSPMIEVAATTVTINCRTRTALGNGGDLTLTAGSSDPSTAAVNGGHVNITAGNGGNSASTGGDVIITPGTATSTNGTVQLRAAAGPSTCTIKIDASGNASISGTTKLVLDQKHVYVENTNGAPTISSGGGAGVTITGSDVAFEITVGTGGPTNVVVNFANAWPTTPQFAVALSSQVGASLWVSALTTTQITIDSNGTALSSGTKIRVLVLGLQ